MGKAVGVGGVFLKAKDPKALAVWYAANLGILWRANKTHSDPDFPNTYPAPRTIAGGIRFTY